METDTAPGDQPQLTTPQLPGVAGEQPTLPDAANAAPTWTSPPLEQADDAPSPRIADGDPSPALTAVPTLPGSGPAPMLPTAAPSEPETPAAPSTTHDHAAPDVPAPNTSPGTDLAAPPPDTTPTPSLAAPTPAATPGTDLAAPTPEATPAPAVAEPVDDATTAPTLAAPSAASVVAFAPPAADAMSAPDLDAPAAAMSAEPTFAPPTAPAATTTFDPPPGDNALANPAAPALLALSPDLTTEPSSGGPVDPGAPLTPTPDWNRRNGGGGRSRVVKIVIFVLIIAAVGAAGWFGIKAISEDASDDTPTPAAGADEADAPTEAPTIIGEAEELVDDVNGRPELDEALDALGLDETLEPVLIDPPPAAPPDAIGSFEFLWWDSSGFEIAVTVDVSTGDYR
ncbi:MAG: hypothetical protein ACR2O6_05940, partial [Ilumatobacteraceae bacterium]